LREMLRESSIPAGDPLARDPRPSILSRGLRLLPILPLLTAAVLSAGVIPAPPRAHADSVPSLAAATEDSASDLSSGAVSAVFARGADGLSPKVLALALDAVSAARARGVSGQTDKLTIIDYSLPSTTPRLWVLDLARGRVLFHELVAHGAGSGDRYATRFSNVDSSRQTSLGLFLTAGTYEGKNGYSLRLKGLDEGINDRAESRAIVMHGAWYASAEHARQFGMLGRSWGCPALPLEDAKPVIDAIKGGSFIYSYAAAEPTAQRAATHAPQAGGAATAKSARKTTD